MSSNIRKFSVKVGGKATSMSLESVFYERLEAIAKERGVPIDQIVTEIDAARTSSNLSSHVREYVLRHSMGSAVAQDR